MPTTSVIRCISEPVACLCPHPVHSLTGGDIVGFDLVALVRDNQVGVPCGQSLFQPPCRLIVYDHHLQGGAVHVPQGIQLLGAAAGQNRQRIREGGKFLKFLLPYAKDGEPGHNQHPANPARLRKCAGNGDSSQCFPCTGSTHFHEERSPFTGNVHLHHLPCGSRRWVLVCSA